MNRARTDDGDGGDGRRAGPGDARRDALRDGVGVDVGDAAPFASALATAIERRGTTLTALRSRLHEAGLSISLATLSYWHHGRRVPSTPQSLEVVSQMEAILDVPSGELTARIRQRRTGRPAAEARYTQFPDTPAILDESLAELGLLGDFGLDEISAHLLAHVDRDGMIESVTNRQVVQAAREGADRLPAVLIADDAFDAPPRIEALRGCYIGRRIDHPEHGASVVEIRLPRPIPLRGTAVIETRLHFPPYEPKEDGEELGYHLTRRLKQCALWVQFDPLATPSYGEAFTLTADGERADVDSQLAEDELQAVVHDFGPGRIYLRWE